ncbi:MAG: hypothetical protein LAO30_09485 [Acidobacteriia bacterium]|nr:hypothetical protein [Terriglobia bacterium]
MLSATIGVAETDPMRSIAKFFKDAGYHGGGSVILAVILFGLTIWEHANNKAVGAWWLWALVVLMFGYGAVVAWHKEYRAGLLKDAQIVQLGARKHRDWNTEWEECADRFTAYINSRVGAEYRHFSRIAETTLEVSGDANLRKHLESLCGLTGEMILASPIVSSALPSEIRTEPDAKTRWLLFLKARGDIRMDVPLYEVSDDKQFPVYLGSIPNLAESSQLACLDCAAKEFQSMRT